VCNAVLKSDQKEAPRLKTIKLASHDTTEKWLPPTLRVQRGWGANCHKANSAVAKGDANFLGRQIDGMLRSQPDVFELAGQLRSQLGEDKSENQLIREDRFHREGGVCTSSGRGDRAENLLKKSITT